MLWSKMMYSFHLLNADGDRFTALPHPFLGLLGMKRLGQSGVTSVSRAGFLQRWWLPCSVPLGPMWLRALMVFQIGRGPVSVQTLSRLMFQFCLLIGSLSIGKILSGKGFWRPCNMMTRISGLQGAAYTVQVLGLSVFVGTGSMLSLGV